MFQSLSSLVPDAAHLLALDVAALGGVLLTHLKSYEGVSNNTVFQHGSICQTNFIDTLSPTGHGQKPEYGDKQTEVNRALLEAWNWLEREGILIRDPKQPAPWFTISRRGEELLTQNARFERFEKLGFDRVKSDLENTGGIRNIGGPPEVQEAAWKWLEMKKNQEKTNAEPPPSARELTLIAESRLTELRKLAPAQFDFKKLIRLCEEINAAYREECYFATAMLTRGLLDHVPPVFGKNTFSEVANNYSGAGRSFKDTMHHLENAARKVADAHLHMPIRKSETLPTAQQVNFASQLDVLLSEIVRITQ
jgi:hypothetical protein